MYLLKQKSYTPANTTDRCIMMRYSFSINLRRNWLMFDGERMIFVFGVASPKSEKKKKSFPHWGFRDR